MSHDTPTDDHPQPTPEGGDDAARLLELGLSNPGDGRAPVASPAELAAQFPQFEILEVIGRGGMGVVYKARQRRLDRLVALKVLPRELGEDPAFAERFAREGRTLAKLQHPHIVGVHDFGEADGQSYLVMEYVDGVNLRTLMEAGELTPKEALAIVPQICAALQYAHDEGVVHRDIKPENVLLDRAGHVKVADFGLAKMAERAPDDFTLTGTDQVMGTLHYMAPEQYRTPQDVDHRADIFSLGVVFYEMLTGELPVGRFSEPSKTGGLDARIDEIVMRALEREREQRYQQAREVATAVSTMGAGEGAAESADASADVSADMSADDAAAPSAHAATRYARRAVAPARRGRDDPRRMSRWVVTTAIFLFLVAPAAGGLAYAYVDWDLPYPRSHAYRGMAGWTVGLIGIGVAGLFAIVAVGVTQGFRARVRGQGAAIALLVLAAASGVAGFLGIAASAENFQRVYREHHEWFRGGAGPDPGTVLTRGDVTVHLPDDWTHADGLDAQARIQATLDRLVPLGERRGVDLEDLALHRLYAQEDVATLRALPEDEAQRGRADGAYGLGMLADSEILPNWLHYRLQLVRVEADGTRATVQVRWAPDIGWLRSDPRPPERVTFPMRRDGEHWVFAIGPVRSR